MSDIRFDFDALKSGWMYRIARRAVLSSVLHLRGVSEVQMPRTYKRVQHLWRRRLGVLHEAGWKPVENLKDFQYMRNCPPFGLECHESHSELHVCRRTKICPWCFARYHVANPLTRLAAYLPIADDRGLVLVSFHRCFRQEPRRGVVEDALRRLAFDRSFEVDLYRPEAAVVLHTFLLTKEQFGFYRRGIFFANPDRVRDAEEEGLVRTYRVLPARLPESIGLIC